MQQLWRFCSVLMGLPVLVVAICFAIGNREPTIITLWPFGIMVSLPIYLLALVPLALGLVTGAGMQWFIALRHRLAAQKLGREIAKLKRENVELKERLVVTETQIPAPPSDQPRNRFRMLSGTAKP
jgi:uncharacterized membrane protein YciS (DUF1049 family)